MHGFEAQVIERAVVAILWSGSDVIDKKAAVRDEPSPTNRLPRCRGRSDIADDPQRAMMDVRSVGYSV